MSTPTTQPRNRLPVAIPWLILLLAGMLRFFRIGHQSLWADEGNSVAQAARSFAEIANAAAADIHPPLYYWLLSIWTQVFGNSEIAVRSLSAVLGLVLVWLVYRIGSRLHDQRTGLVAAFFAAINPFLIVYSQETRMYALLAMLVGLLFYALIRFILHEAAILPADGSGKSVAFSAPATALFLVAAIAGLYTHYTFPLLLATATLLYLFWVYDSRRRGFVKLRLLHWGLLLIVIAFFFSPWISTAYRQLTAWPSRGASIGFNQALAQIMRLLALGPVAQVESTSFWMTTFVVLFALGLWPWVRPGRSRAHWLSWGLPLLWLAAPVASMLLAGLYKEAFFKFLLVAVVPFCLLMARGATGFMDALERVGGKGSATNSQQPAASHKRPGTSSKRRVAKGKRRAVRDQPWRPGEAAKTEGKAFSAGYWLGRIWLAVLLILMAIPSGMTLRAYYFDPSVARDDYRGIAAYIRAVEHPNDAIILNAPGQREVFAYYYDGSLPIYGLPEQRPADKAATIARLEQIASQHRRLYGLFWATDESDPERIVEGWLDTHAYKAVDSWQGNMRFLIYATRQPSDDWPIQAADALLGDQIRLIGFALSSQVIQSGDVLQLQLRWRAERQPTGDYTVFVQLLDERNQVVAQRDAPPVSGSRPTSGWQSGEQIVDNHGVYVLPATAPGDYRLIIGMYDVQTGQRLPSAMADYIELGVVRVERPDSPPPLQALNMQHDESFAFEEVTLLGYDRYKRGFRHAPKTPLHANDLLHLTFYWRADVRPTAAWWFTARLVQGAGKEVAAASGPLVSEQYPTLNWQQGEIVRGEHDLLLPDYLQPGRYQMQLFLHTGNPEAAVDRVNLGTVVISE